jgi:hypothetical protein
MSLSIRDREALARIAFRSGPVAVCQALEHILP